MSARPGWIGVDLDGTLAVALPANEWPGLAFVGAPVPAMVERVRQWLVEGEDVRILTARAYQTSPVDLANALRPIREWCLAHLGRVLPITCQKDQYMTELWDDRAVAVERNTGAFKRYERREAEPVPARVRRVRYYGAPLEVDGWAE